MTLRMRLALNAWALVLVAAAPVTLMASLPSYVIIDEQFDSYADQAALETVWQPSNPQNVLFLDLPYGTLIPDSPFIVPPPNDYPPDLEGKAVYIDGGLNVYAGAAQPNLDLLTPTPTHSIKLSGDIFDDGRINKRATIGLRHVQPGSDLSGNIIELGQFNAAAQDPTDPAPNPPFDQPATGFAYRVVLFGPFGPPLERQPNWQYFPLNPSLDGLDGDTLVRPNDIGPGWHRYSAEIGVDFVTMTLDLFRDGVDNATNTPGVDSTVTWSISPLGAPFNRLQIGGPSGLSTAFGAVVDNIRLEYVAIPEPNAGSLLAITMLAVRRRR